MEATIGGTRRHLGQLAHNLGRHDVEVVVACSSLRTSDFRRDVAAMIAAGIEVVEIPMARQVRPGADLRALMKLRQLIRHGGFDVVHTHSSKAGALGRAAAHLGRGPAVVHTPHSFAFLHDAEFSRLKRRLYLLVERRLGRRTTRMVAVSRAEGDAAVRHGIVPRDRITVIWNGVEAELAPSRPRSEIRRELGIGSDAPVLVSVGLLEVSKGHRFLVEAVGRVMSDLPELRCLIVGDGSRRRELEEQCRGAGLASNITFTGHRRDAVDLIAAGDALVLPSLWEGLPYVILEAMALAVPVVSSDVGGCGELLDHGTTGLLVPAADATALAGAITDLLRDPARPEGMGRQGRDRARSRFSVDEMMARYARLYAEVV